MKKWICLLAFMSLLLSATAKEKKLPSGVFKYSEVEAAKEHAKKEKRPIIFLNTDLNSSCPKCNGATSIVMDFTKRGFTIVVIEFDKVDIAKLPRFILDNIDHKKVGVMIPRGFIANTDGTECLLNFSYDDLTKNLKETDKKFKEIAKTEKSKK